MPRKTYAKPTPLPPPKDWAEYQQRVKWAQMEMSPESAARRYGVKLPRPGSYMDISGADRRVSAVTWECVVYGHKFDGEPQPGVYRTCSRCLWTERARDERGRFKAKHVK